MKRGFTLIELLVVISIIAMLASVVAVSTQSVQARGRDAKRIQQIDQLNLATRLYMLNHDGKAPNLGGLCVVQSLDPQNNPADGSACFAVSTAGVSTPEGQAWEAYMNDLNPYLPTKVTDPCPSCSSQSGQSLGYTYVAPRALLDMCLDEGNCPDPARLNESYQVYAPLEKADKPTGESTFGDDYYSKSADQGPTHIVTVTAHGGTTITPPAGRGSPCVGEHTCQYSIPEGEVTFTGALTNPNTQTTGYFSWIQGPCFGSDPACTFYVMNDMQLVSAWAVQ